MLANQWEVPYEQRLVSIEPAAICCGRGEEWLRAGSCGDDE